ncbi:MAG: hypothetical protein NXI10_04730 [bacterium]|nr:hypothetical protein [bacterium]
MKLTDEQIDKLFRDSASKQSFDYKPEYWEEFSASLSDSAPLSEASDDALDAAFQSGAANQSFEYKQEFWEEFSASLPDNTPLSQAPDEALDAAFQKDASQISVDYNPEFWNEFSDELPIMVATEDVTDAEVDALYREEAEKLSFVYHPSYWEEMAAMLRRRRRRPEFVWLGLSGVFATAIIAMFFIEQSSVKVPSPNLAWNDNSLTNSVEKNGTVASNQESNSDNTAVQNANEAQNSASNTALNVNQNGNISADGQNAGNSIDPINGSTSNNDTLVVTNNIGTNSNNSQATPRLNRFTPNLVLNGPQLESTLSANEQRTVENNDITLNPMDSKVVSPLSEDNGELADVFAELPKLPTYKGGIQKSLYVQGVTGISQALVQSANTPSTSFGIGGGIQLNKNRWVFNAGANVIVENHTDLAATSIVKEYGGAGSIEFRQTAEYNNLYKAELDFSFGYSLGRHQIRMGIRPSFVYNALADYKLYSYDTRSGSVIETEDRVDNTYGYLSSMNRFGLRPTLGYAYAFPGNWSLGLSLGTELVPTFKDEYLLETNNRVLPIDGQLYLRKTLNLKK